MVAFLMQKESENLFLRREISTFEAAFDVFLIESSHPDRLFKQLVFISYVIKQQLFYHFLGEDNAAS